MAEKNIATIQDAAKYLRISKLALWKIMDGTNKPTVENCNKVLLKGRFSANWFYLNIGEKYLKQSIELENIAQVLRAINKKINHIQH